MIRLTVSRYYTPSGRCIQKPYEKGHSEEYYLELYNRYKAAELFHADSIPRVDSLRYETLKNHRPVYGGGGIIPDVFVPVDTTKYSTYYRDLIAKGIVNKTVMNYVDANRAQLKQKYPNEEAFVQNFTMPEELLNRLVSRALDDGIEFRPDDWERSKPMIEAIMTGLMGRDLYENASYYRHLTKFSNEFNEALRLINDPERYNALLKGSK